MEIYPDFSEFERLAGSYNLVPVWTEALADLETPVGVFMKVTTGSETNFLLESVEQGGRLGRYSFIGLQPEQLFKSSGNTVEIEDQHFDRKRIETKDPLRVLEEIVNYYRQPKIPQLPIFAGGAVGYVSYDYVRFIEKIPDLLPDELGFPGLYFQLCFDIIVFDHLKRKIQVISNARIEKGDLKQFYRKSCEKIESIISIIRKPLPIRNNNFQKKKAEFVSNCTETEFESSVSRAKKYIKAGDIIQVVLSQRWERPLDVNPLSVYRSLRSINPSPYMFNLCFPGFYLIGSSPEILVRCNGTDALLRPIAGTRPRGKDDAEDEKLAEELKKDTKEIAEHIMLVDLGRNDLGRVCRYGSVKVTDLMFVEKYSHVMHLVTNITGKLAKGKNQFDLLRACFPAGTVSGAPKVRAMEIIEELEKSKRGPYAGAVGYFSFQSDMDFCITIRTMFSSQGKIYIQAGAGIVADSVPEREYLETINKAKALSLAYEKAKDVDYL
ncbi:MAG: anthranilate synthase component I [Candidatus Omnitrophica bacterium]|nr:anthranilate synthase component I [Candidatus Omnitrophota bacterium]MCM8825115.1 anthranilate synthase component I [Candidatus Omnitrophota bacterium]MCM8827757.1 anthranilate synthase component I [Candidatus Omnitrophota bacterium]